MSRMKTFNVYKQVITSHSEYLKFIGTIQATDRNDACVKFRTGEYQNNFLTAKLVV